MFKCDWHPETFSPTGNSTADGVRNQLGRPELDPLTLLVREAAQNSWDARLNEGGVTFGIAGRTLTPDEKKSYREQIFPDYPPNIEMHRLWTGSEPPAILSIYDRGTTGLTGPTRADLAAETDERNFVAFLRNIGQPRKATYGGGTYGYGKAVFYSISSLGAICVHTRCRTKKGIESRFIAAALGEPHKRMTGRHWWGIKARDGIVDPISGEAADLIAEKLGLTPFSKNETGTTIVILLPDFGEVDLEDEQRHKRTPLEGMAYMAASMLWNFWPRMLANDPEPAAIRFEASWQGRKIPVPDPADHPGFHGFVKAMELAKKVHRGDTVRQTDNQRTINIACKRPARDLGLLSLHRYPSLPSGSGVVSGVEAAIRQLAPSWSNSHHVALMRNTEIVVRYEPGPPSDGAQYSGVFLVSRDEEVDRAFADSEPPTHDNWEPSVLEGRTGTLVRVGLRRIKENVAEFASAGQPGARPAALSPLGAFSEHLAGLVSTTEGTSPTVTAQKTGSAPGAGGTRTRRERQPEIEVLGEPELIDFNGKPACRVSFRVTPVPGTASTVISAEPRVALLDGSVYETDAPAGAELPTVIGWEVEKRKQPKPSEKLQISGSTEQICSVLVSIPANAAVGVFLEARRGGAE